MSYKPSKKEIKQVENLNKGYQLIKDGLKLIKDSLPKKDGDVEMQAYKMSKNFDKIIKRIHALLEKQYVNSQFIEIINSKAPKKKGGRFDKLGKRKSNKKGNNKRKPKG
jgi:hypothetical protein